MLIIIFAKIQDLSLSISGERPVIVWCDALEQQRSDNEDDICRHLKFVQCLSHIPSIQKSHGRSIIENRRSALRGTITLPRTTLPCGGCDGACLPRVHETIRIEESYEGTIM